MTLRLMFSIATSAPGDIILMDEWISAGDEAFQQKAQGRMQEIIGKAGILVIQGNEMPTFPDFPIYRVTQKYGQLKSARGHSYKACELALKQLASHRFPLEKAITHTFGLKQVDEAIKAVAGKGPADVIHVSVDPWK